jgi:uncharacterized protein (DUF1501 family)
MLLAGSYVKGGFYGTPADLAHLEQGDVPCTTDFRSIYASVLQYGLGLKPQLDVKPFEKPLLERAV